MTSTNTAPEAKIAKPRRMARESDATPTAPASPRAPSKLDQVETLLLAPGGTSIAELMVATGWQQHSVRGAMAGALKKRGLTISSEKVEGTGLHCHGQNSSLFWTEMFPARHRAGKQLKKP